MLPFGSLHAGHLIATDYSLIVLGQLWRFAIKFVDRFYLFVELLVWFRRQPIADLVRLEITVFLKVCWRDEARCFLQCLVSSVRQRSLDPSND
jgi:hypothetical protein